MKTITFFSEKGGVGKSTFSIMYASWLHDKMGAKVALADFNNRIKLYREAEKRSRNKFIQNHPETDIRPFDERTTWPIVTCLQRDIIKLSSETSIPYGRWFDEQISKGGSLHDYDIVICDFPGSLTGGEFMQINSINKMSLVVIPTENDEMTLNSTIRLHNMIHDRNHCLFINKAQLGLKNFRGRYFRLGEILIKQGLPVLPDMVSYSERITTIDKVDIIRSTFGFPEFESPEYGMGKDLGIINLFIDVTRELAKCPDLRGTEASDLSFASELVKTKDGRQLKGTPYRAYEI